MMNDTPLNIPLRRMSVTETEFLERNNNNCLLNNSSSSNNNSNNNSGKATTVTTDSSSVNSESSNKDVVSFRSRASIEEIRRISRVSQYDLEEIINYWGDSDEHELRKSELRRAVKEMHYTRRLSDNDFTTLGIDDKAGVGRALRKANTKLSRNAVMDEQSLQNGEGIPDQELLGEVYAITATPAKRGAKMKADRLHEELRRGIQRQDARRILQEQQDRGSLLHGGRANAA